MNCSRWCSKEKIIDIYLKWCEIITTRYLAIKEVCNEYYVMRGNND